MSTPDTSQLANGDLPDQRAIAEETILSAIREFEDTLDCRIGVAYTDIAAGVDLQYRSDELFHAASTMKVPVMIEVFRQAEKGLFDLNDTLVFDPVCESFIDGSDFTCDAGRNLKDRLNEEISIFELTREMIIVSDNLATNILIDLCGYKKINHTVRELGVENGYVLRGVQDIEAYQAGLSNRFTPSGLNVLMRAIDEDKAASPESCRQMRGILMDQYYTDMIPDGLPEGVKVGNKTGSVSGVRHDTAIVFTDHGNYYLTIFMDRLKEPEKGTKASIDLSRVIYDQRQKLVN